MTEYPNPALPSVILTTLCVFLGIWLVVLVLVSWAQGGGDGPRLFDFAAVLLVPFVTISLLTSIFGLRGNFPKSIEFSGQSLRVVVEWPRPGSHELWLSEVRSIRPFLFGGVLVSGGPYFVILTWVNGNRARTQWDRWRVEHVQ